MLIILFLLSEQGFVNLKSLWPTYYFHFSMLFIRLYKTIFFHLFFFIIIVYILNIVRTIKKKTIKKYLSMKTIVNVLHFLKNTVIIQWNVRRKDLVSFSIKLIEEIPDPSNPNEYYQCDLNKKHKKLVKQ